MGRPSKLNNAVLSKIPDMVRLDLSQTEIAEILGVEQSTVSNWMSNNPDFFINYRLEQAKLNNRVKSSLYDRAIGMELKEEKTHESPNGISTTIVKKQIPPDVEAGKFILTNRRPNEWRQSPEVVVNAAQMVRIENPDGTQRAEITFTNQPDAIEAPQTVASALPTGRDNEE